MLEHELEDLLNRHSAENDSNTPDFLLARYLMSCLEAFNKGVKDRDRWYGVVLEPGNSRFIENDILSSNTKGEK